MSTDEQRRSKDLGTFRERYSRMAAIKLKDGLHIIAGLVNMYLLKIRGGLTLVDAGSPRDVSKILSGGTSTGRKPRYIHHVLLTHAHPDHIGGAAALREITGTSVYAHRFDAPILEAGGPFRPWTSVSGLRNWVVVFALNRTMRRVAPCCVDRRLDDGIPVPFDRDLVPIHIPGHCKGQVAFRWQSRDSTLSVANACINRKDMVLAAAQENAADAHASLTKIPHLCFDAVCFGHGQLIMEDADFKFQKRWNSGEI